LDNKQLQEIELRNKQAEDYYNIVLKFRGEFRIEVLKSMLKSFLHSGKNDTILDAGCGTGIFTEIISGFCPGSKIEAVDFSESSLDILKRTIENKNISNIYPELADLKSFSGSEKSFDKIISLEVIQHIPDEKDIEKIFANFCSLLKDNGKVLILVYRWGGFIKPPAPKIEYTDISRRAFSEKEMTGLLTRAGFRKVKNIGIYRLPKAVRKYGFLNMRLKVFLEKLLIKTGLFYGRSEFLFTIAEK